MIQVFRTQILGSLFTEEIEKKLNFCMKKNRRKFFVLLNYCLGCSFQTPIVTMYVAAKLYNTIYYKITLCNYKKNTYFTTKLDISDI